MHIFHSIHNIENNIVSIIGKMILVLLSDPYSLFSSSRSCVVTFTWKIEICINGKQSKKPVDFPKT